MITVLSMIVKNEAHVIERCLNSVKPYIDSWVIVDTGSTDGTQDLIMKIMRGLPGELVELPWVDFSTNRNQALKLARQGYRADYILVMDADDVLSGYSWSGLTAAGYQFTYLMGEISWQRTALIRSDLPWWYAGVIHEYLVCGEDVTTEPLPDVYVNCLGDGGRSQVSVVEKYAADARLLRKAVLNDPKDSRAQFYLASAFRDSEQWDAAMVAYRKRTTMDGFIEEVYDSYFNIAQLSEREESHDTIVAAYLDAYQFRPTRAEPLCALARYLRLQECYHTALIFAEKAATMPAPDDLLFVDQSVYRWRALDEWAVSAYWAGQYRTSALLCQQLLSLVPESQRERVTQNLEFAQALE